MKMLSKIFMSASKEKSSLGLGFITLLFFIFLYLPIIIIVLFSFNANKIASIWGGFSTKWYVSAINNSALLDSLQVSLTVAFLATLFATSIAVAAALALTRSDEIRFKNVSNTVVNLPLMLPEIVFAVAILILFSQLGIKNGMFKLILAHTCFCIPFAFLPIRARLQGMNTYLEQAAQDLYASPWVTFKRITLPIIMPGVFAGGMLSFVISMDDFITSNILSGGGATTLPVYIFSLVKQGVSPELNAISTLIMLVPIVFATPIWLLTKQKIKS
ncbi:ABC transporter permease [Psychromonas sp. SR45-3]|uniref:ABC transporter permease n=1 Tax=Psychromonas sp. SR45-3 TaxID=2760930 RepID=UPI0021758C5F|nr:ABC transporter permease [Psychromonas sp. SR45-3]